MSNSEKSKYDMYLIILCLVLLNPIILVVNSVMIMLSITEAGNSIKLIIFSPYYLVGTLFEFFSFRSGEFNNTSIIQFDKVIFYACNIIEIYIKPSPDSYKICEFY